MKQEGNFKHQINHARLKIANEFVRSFSRYLKAARIYPKGHQLLSAEFERFHDTLRQTSAKISSLVLKIFENNLYVFDQPIDAAQFSEALDCIKELQKRYIRQIIFYSGASVNDINLLIELLTTAPEIIDARGGASFMFFSLGVQNIRIIEYYSIRHSEFDIDKLNQLADSEIFRFFVDLDRDQLAQEEAYSLYNLLRDPKVASVLIKMASDYIISEKKSQLPEIKIVQKILQKIRIAISSLEISEDEEIKSIFRDLIFSFHKTLFFHLAFDPMDEPLIEPTQSLSFISKRLAAEEIAELIAQTIAGEHQIADHVKKLFALSTDKTVFTPAFFNQLKENLIRNISPLLDALTIARNFYSSMGEGIVFEDDIELALGAIPGPGTDDIVNGLNIMRDVHVQKSALEKSIIDFNADSDYILLLQKLISVEQNPAACQKIYYKLKLALNNYLKEDNLDTNNCKKIFSFLLLQISHSSTLASKYKQWLIEEINNIPALLIEKLIRHYLLASDTAETKNVLQMLYQLFQTKLTSILINMYVQEEYNSHAEFLQQMVLEEFKIDFQKLKTVLRQETSIRILKYMHLLSQVPDDIALDCFWEITFCNDMLLAQRALRWIVREKSDKALSLLLTAISHPNPQIRLSALDFLSAYKNQTVIETLIKIVRKGIDNSNDCLNIEYRMMAAQSLCILDQTMAEQILREVIQNKRLWFFAAEPQKLRLFAKKQLRGLK